MCNEKGMTEREDITTNLITAARRIVVAVAVVLLAACKGDEEPAATLVVQPQAVGFGAYVNRNTTRGGHQGSLTLEALKNGNVGFGVYAFYTDNHAYNQLSLANFMYNQQVTWQTDAWTYSPMKYWPNETGKNAISSTIDYVSFFAYAPYTAVDDVTGCALSNPTTGITALSRAIDTGDPIVRYYAAMKPDEAVDLCWAAPHLNETKPDNVNDKVEFNFRHALAALNVQIDADIDVVSHAASSLDANTRIWVRSITFRGFADRGQLNLNNSRNLPRWNNLDCDCDLTSQPVTIYDGRRDGCEGVASSLNEQKQGLNPVIVQSGAYTTDPSFASTTDGVTNTQVNLFDVSGMTSATDEKKRLAPIYVIPTNEAMRVTIVYDVETYDPKLTSQYLSDGRTHGSTIENSISAYITDGSGRITMQAGKQYNINIHLGMVSVKVDASVTAWAEGATAEVDLPEN